MQLECGNESGAPTGFIGYQQIQQPEQTTIRIFLNCKSETQFEACIDVVFYAFAKKNEEPEFQGLNQLSTIKKFNRFVGCLEEIARNTQTSRTEIFQNIQNLLHFLSLVKNSKQF